MEASQLQAHLESLLKSANQLLFQLQSFEDHIFQSIPPHAQRYASGGPVIGLKGFKSQIQAEKKSLEKEFELLSSRQMLPLDDVEAPNKPPQVLRCSNMHYFTSVWAIAAQCHAIKAVRNRVSYRYEGRKRNAMVDIVAENGEQWVKVSTMKEHRMLLEIAKEGLAMEDFDSSDSDVERSEDSNASGGKMADLSELGIIRHAIELKQAAQHTWINYMHPKIRLVFPNILEGKTKQIDLILSEIRSLGVIVECSGSLKSYEQLQSSTTSMDSLFQVMTPLTYYPPLTQMLNLDCSILISLVSDISHCAPSTLPPSDPASTSAQQYNAVQREIEYEGTMPLLPNNVYPILRGRKLVCIPEVVDRCQEIVNTMGTEREKKRLDWLLDPQNDALNENGVQQLRAAFQGESIHELPDDLQIPIEIQIFDRANSPSMIHELKLSSIHKSVFFHGLMRDITTITSSKLTAREVRQRILKWAEENNPEQIGGPKVCVSAFSRSLLGKGKKTETCMP
ncbi:MAG: hypothetical protein Q9160_008063 [Pyrenula sp. 1 TL-2023]